jgi:hypothetical protein
VYIHDGTWNVNKVDGDYEVVHKTSCPANNPHFFDFCSAVRPVDPSLTMPAAVPHLART